MSTWLRGLFASLAYAPGLSAQGAKAALPVGVANRTDAVVSALDRGLLDPSDLKGHRVPEDDAG